MRYTLFMNKELKVKRYLKTKKNVKQNILWKKDKKKE